MTEALKHGDKGLAVRRLQQQLNAHGVQLATDCLLYTSPSPRDS